MTARIKLIYQDRWVIWVVVGFAVVALLFAIGHLQLIRQQQRIANQGERLVFHYRAVRELVIRALLRADYQGLKPAVEQFRGLHASLAAIRANPLIPGRYKDSLVTDSDLAGLMVLLSEVGGRGEAAKVERISEELRQMDGSLELFSRQTLEHLHRKMVGFQSLAIGVLVIAVLLLGNFLFFLLHRLLVPLQGVRRQLAEMVAGRRQELAGAGLPTWPAAMVDQINTVLARGRQDGAKGITARQEAFARCAQLLTVGSLVPGISHQLNETTNTMINYGQLILETEAEEQQERRRLCRAMLAAGERLAQLSRRLLVISRRPMADVGVIRPDRLVSEMLDLVEPQLRADGIALHRHCSPVLPTLAGNHHELGLVLLHVINNSREAIQRCGSSPKGERWIKVTTAVRRDGDAAPMVEVVVVDSGCGMNAMELEQAWTPFCTAAGQGDQPGLGLAVSRWVVEKYGGKIGLESREGGPTTVRIVLPVSPPEPSSRCPEGALEVAGER